MSRVGYITAKHGLISEAATSKIKAQTNKQINKKQNKTHTHTHARTLRTHARTHTHIQKRKKRKKVATWQQEVMMVTVLALKKSRFMKFNYNPLKIRIYSLLSQEYQGERDLIKLSIESDSPFMTHAALCLERTGEIKLNEPERQIVKKRNSWQAVLERGKSTF